MFENHRKIVSFNSFLNTWSLWSNSVTRQVNFHRTNIGGKCQNWKKSNETFFGDFQTLCKSYLINLPVTILMTVCNVIRRKDAKPKVEKVVPLGQKLPLLLRDASLNSISDFAPDFVASSKATSIFWWRIQVNIKCCW